MLTDIEELTQEYIPIEPDRKQNTTSHMYIECLFEIKQCHNMSLNDIATFLRQVVDITRTTKVKTNGRFICAVQGLLKYDETSDIPKKVTFIKDNSGISLEFCKIRECSHTRWSNIRDHFEYSCQEIIYI